MVKIKGFTLIELIVVMGILAILATIVVIAVNPGRQFAASRNAKRASDTRAIANALTQYAADNNGQNYASLTTTSQSIGTSGLNLATILVPNYLSAIPKDPDGGTDATTKYYVFLDESSRPVVSSIGELNTFIHGGGTGHLLTRGVIGSYAHTPDSAPLSITGDIDLRARVALTDWTPAAEQTLIGKALSGTQMSYLFDATGAGALRFYITSDGVSLQNVISSVHGIPDGTAKWVRVTRRQSDGQVQFFLSDDGVTWTQLGANTTLAATSAIYDGTTNLNIGSYANGNNLPAAGRFYRAQILNGINGTVVFDADFTKIPPGVALTFPEGSANAATVTVVP